MKKDKINKRVSQLYEPTNQNWNNFHIFVLHTPDNQLLKVKYYINKYFI